MKIGWKIYYIILGIIIGVVGMALVSILAQIGT